MMLLLLLLSQVSGRTPYDVVVPNAIVAQHNLYVACQDRHFDDRRVRDRASFRGEVERAITACATQKAALKQEAEAVLARSPGYADQAARQAALVEAFDGYDRTRRLMANFFPQ